MPDVSLPGGPTVPPMAPEDVAWLRSLPPADRARFLYPGQLPPTDDHLTGVRVGLFGTSMQCTTCGTVCTWVPGPFTITHWADDAQTVVDWERVAEGYWIGPPDDRIGHRYVLWRRTPTPGQDDITPQLPTSDEASKAPRPAGITAAQHARSLEPEHRKQLPSRSPEARRAEYQRAKRRAVRTRV